MPEFIIRAEETDLFFLFRDYKELIRCKDCKAYNGMKCVRNNMIAVRAEDFCSRAERKEK